MATNFDSMEVKQIPGMGWELYWKSGDKVVYEKTYTVQEVYSKYPSCMACLKYRQELIKLEKYKKLEAKGSYINVYYVCPACDGVTRNPLEMPCDCGNFPHNNDCPCSWQQATTGHLGKQIGGNWMRGSYRPTIDWRTRYAKPKCILHRKRRLP